MKLSRYNQFTLNESVGDIHLRCKEYGIEDYTINEDNSIDVNRGVYFNGFGLTKLPLKFNRINGNFECSENKLTSLEGCPKYVNGNFYCDNNKLDSLKGCPEYVSEYFDCRFNNITSLEWFPELYEGLVFVNDNPVCEIVYLFPYERRDRAIYWINEFDVIRDGNKVVLDRLEEVFVQMELDIPSKIKFKNYEII